MGSLTETRGRIVIEVDGDWAYDTRELLDWIDMKLAAEAPTDWGAGRGGINYASGRVVSVERLD